MIINLIVLSLNYHMYNKYKDNILNNYIITDTIINIHKIDSIQYNIKKKDSIITTIKNNITYEIQETNNSNDSIAIWLFTKLVSE